MVILCFSHFHRRYKEKKEDGAEPEVDPERDQRTVFAYQVQMHLECLFYHVFVALMFFLLIAYVKFFKQFLTDILEG